MKIYSKSVFEFDELSGCYVLSHAESKSLDYDGKVSLCKGGDGGGGGGTTIQKSEPWDQAKPYSITGFEEAGKYLNSPTPQYYPGQTVAPFSPETETALSLQTNRAMNGSPIQTSATNELSKIIGGNYLYGGDAFNAAFDAAARKINPMVDSAFEMGGRGNSGLAQVAKTQALGDAFASQYTNATENQMRAMFAAPQVANLDYQDISKLSEVGAQRENLAQQQIQSDISKYDFDQNARLAQVNNYLAMINGNGVGGTTTTTSPTYSNRGALGLGGAIGGATLGNMLFPAAAGATPWGAVGGGSLGLLGSLF